MDFVESASVNRQIVHPYDEGDSNHEAQNSFHSMPPNEQNDEFSSDCHAQTGDL